MRAFARFAHDVGHALRGVRRRPGFAVVAALTLALGIGANATMFGVVDRLLLRPPAHVVEPERVVEFVLTVRSPYAPEPFVMPAGDYAGFAALRDRARSFERVAGYLGREITLGRGRDAQLVRATATSASLFPLLGVRPALGRFFQEDEDRVGTTAWSAVLGHDLWRSRFGGDSAVLGRSIYVQGSRFTVVGVAPAGFGGIAPGRVDLWLPLHVAAPFVMNDQIAPDGSAATQWQQTGGSWLAFVARLRPGVSAAAASAEATALVRQSRDARTSAGEGVSVAAAPVFPRRAADRSGVTRIALWLMAMAGLVLLVACANVANLLLARAVERRREIAVRLAMGAPRGRLVAQLLAEGCVLAAIGGAAALLAAYWGAGALRTVLLPGFDWSSPPIDGRVFAATAAVTLGTGLLAGLVPALQASRPDLVGALKLGERSGGSTTHSRTRAALLVAQTTLCVVLLVAAGLFVRSLHNLRTADLGLDADRALAATVELSAVPGYTRDRIAAFFDDAAAAVRTLPDVERVSLATAYPFAFGMYGGTLELPGRPADSLARLSRGVPYEFDVTPGYFATLGVPLRRGRDFTDAHRAGAPRVLIVNEALARLYWPGEDPVGRCARIAGHGPECAEVVGVVASSHLRRVREEEPSLAYFVPLAQSLDSYTGATRALLVRPRAGADPAVVAGHVRKRMQSLARDLPYVSVGSLGGRVAFELEPARLGATLFTLFGALALAVAAVGLYGVVSFGVAQRTREFGVRLALGATGGRVVRLVLREGVRYAAIGIALGLAAALAGGRLLAPFLYGVSPHELSVLGSVSAVLLAVAVVACTLPAWRATRVDPASALRSE